MENQMEETLKLWLFDPTVGKFITAAIALIIVIAVSRVIKGSIKRYVKNVDSRYRLRKFITFLSYIVIILLLTLIFSDRLGGLTVAMGVAGAGVAFALQEVIASFAGWFAITFANFFSTGDRVQLGGIKGDVIDVSFLRTTIMEIGEWVKGDLYTGRVVRVANSFVFKEPVFNYSGDFPFLWDEITIPVKYGSDHKQAREILEKIAEEVTGEFTKNAVKAWDEMLTKYLLEDAGVEPMVTLVANDNWMEFTVRYVVNFKSRRKIKNQLFTRILDEFIETDGKVEFASTTFQLVEAPTFDVRLSGAENLPEKDNE